MQGFSWAPSGEAIYFERTFNGATNLWKMTVDPKTLRGTGIERLTTAPGNDTGLAMTSDGKNLAFSAESRQIQIWSAPFDPRSGKLIGKGEAVTPPGLEAWVPSLTPDGKRLVFSGDRGGSWKVWQQSMVGTFPTDGNPASLSSPRTAGSGFESPTADNGMTSPGGPPMGRASTLYRPAGVFITSGETALTQ
jgi:Tol biopolymer transport system component